MDQVILIHRETVCVAPVINLEKLESAVGAAFQTFDGSDLHPTLVDKAAKLLEGIAIAHGFLDGNKRIAWQSCVTFLNLNNLDMCGVTEEQAAALVFDVLEHRLEFHELVDHLNEHVELLSG